MTKRRRIYLSQTNEGILYNVSSDLGNLEVALVTTTEAEDGSVTGYTQIATVEKKSPKNQLDKLEATIKEQNTKDEAK